MVIFLIDTVIIITLPIVRFLVLWSAYLTIMTTIMNLIRGYGKIGLTVSIMMGTINAMNIPYYRTIDNGHLVPYDHQRFSIWRADMEKYILAGLYWPGTAMDIIFKWKNDPTVFKRLNRYLWYPEGISADRP